MTNRNTKTSAEDENAYDECNICGDLLYEEEGGICWLCIKALPWYRRLIIKLFIEKLGFWRTYSVISTIIILIGVLR